ncbi:MAG: molybdopterin cofactor-binding domain-containing protein, partial [Pseudomonadota bacterium]
MTLNTSRRGFLQGAAAAGAVLAIGLDARGVLAKTDAAGGTLTPFVTVSPEGKVTAIVKHFEMGQGTTTGLTSLIAEEMNLTLEAVDYVFAPSDNDRYKNLLFGIQGTGGSTAMANSFMQYRQAGAAAREMLLAAAAQDWGVDVAELSMADGVISGAGQTGTLGAFVATAVTLPVPDAPPLKEASAFRVIGNPESTRKDTGSKINGTAVYAMDLHLDNQLVVMIARTPRFGGKVASFDAGAASEVRGFVQAAALPNGAGVAVYAETTWAALQARDMLDVTWDFSEAEGRSSEEIQEELLAAVRGEAQFDASSEIELSETTAALEAAEQLVEAEFYLPMLAHAPMEPLTCTIEPTAEGIVLHDGCQIPGAAHMTIAQVLEMPPEQITVNTVYAGGSFGRRATPYADYHVEAALVFAMTDRSRPVKLVWSREDDITGGAYRPAFAHRVRVGLDAEGGIVGWDHRIAGQSIFKGTFFEEFVVRDGVDHSSVEGVPDTPYAIPGMHVGLTDAQPSTSVNWWRSVGHSHTAYVMESVMDMVAQAAGQDPLAYRLRYLPGETPDQQRLAGVLELAAEKAGWRGALLEGHSQGIAAHKSFGSYVAQVVEISRDADDLVQIQKVVSAVDCGIAVNPDVIAAQIEGGIGYGIGHVMRNEITLDGGEVVQSNFPD